MGDGRRVAWSDFNWRLVYTEEDDAPVRRLVYGPLMLLQLRLSAGRESTHWSKVYQTNGTLRKEIR